jgi:hypothetical protein
VAGANSLGSAELTGPVQNFTGLTDAATDCAKLTDTRNHLMSTRKASDGQETP